MQEEKSEQNVLNGDCLELLPQLEANCFTTLVTDPPYGWNYAGNAWDKALPDPRVWKECLRVLKPGAFGFVMAGARQDCLWRIIRDLEDAGFNTSFPMLTWVFLNGMPKGTNISRKIDQRLGVEPTPAGEYQPPGMKSAWNLKQNQDENVEGSGGTFTASQRRTLARTQATSEEAKEWDGWIGGSSALRPAHEQIIVVQKPFYGTITDNVLAHGCGAMNCEATKINGRLPATLITEDLVPGLDHFNISEWWKNSGILNFKKPRGKDKVNHPTQKPVELMAWLIQLSTPPGGFVLDPFAGSGTTLVAAKLLGRKALGIELDREYIELARGRLSGA